MNEEDSFYFLEGLRDISKALRKIAAAEVLKRCDGVYNNTNSDTAVSKDIDLDAVNEAKKRALEVIYKEGL